MKNLDNNFITEVEDCISKWNLHKLGKEEYLKLREYYNKTLKDKYNRESAVVLYCLIAYAFNNQIAFNSKNEFNTPSGYRRSWLNPALKNKLIKYIENMKDKNISFISEDFLDIEMNYDKNTFVYCDPPYLITVGAYERDYFCKWSEEKERQLLSFLESLDKNKIKFALSNVLHHKGKTNTFLENWISKYNVFHLSKDYKSCNYQTHNREIKTSDEVLITNY